MITLDTTAIDQATTDQEHSVALRELVHEFMTHLLDLADQADAVFINYFALIAPGDAALKLTRRASVIDAIQIGQALLNKLADNLFDHLNADDTEKAYLILALTLAANIDRCETADHKRHLKMLMDGLTLGELILLSNENQPMEDLARILQVLMN